MQILNELRKWGPLIVITLATIAAVVFTGEYIDQRAPIVDPLREFAE